MAFLQTPWIEIDLSQLCTLRRGLVKPLVIHHDLNGIFLIRDKNCCQGFHYTNFIDTTVQVAKTDLPKNYKNYILSSKIVIASNVSNKLDETKKELNNLGVGIIDSSCIVGEQWTAFSIVEKVYTLNFEYLLTTCFTLC